jgi:hypothetical protein
VYFFHHLNLNKRLVPGRVEISYDESILEVAH